MKKIFILIILLLPSIEAKSQNAINLYEQARNYYEQENFTQSINYLLRCKQTLGKTNPKIEALLAQAYLEKGDIINAKIAIDKLFIMTPESKKRTQNFRIFLDLKKTIDSEMKKQEEIFQRKRMEKSLDAINEIENKRNKKNAEKVKNKSENRQKYFFEKLKNTTDKTLLAEYQQAFPNNPYNNKIDKTIADIKKWEYAQRENTRSAYEKYIDKFPNGKFISEVKKIMADIDKKAFEKAKQENTQESYKFYIKNYKEKYYLGAYKKQAKSLLDKRKDYDKYMRAVKSKNIYYYQDYIKSYPNGIYAKQANRVIQDYYKENGDKAYNQEKWKLAIKYYSYYLQHYPYGMYYNDIHHNTQVSYKKDGDKAFKSNKFREAAYIYDEYLYRFPNGMYTKKISHRSKRAHKLYKMNNYNTYAMYWGIIKGNNISPNADKFPVGINIYSFKKTGISYYFGMSYSYISNYYEEHPVMEFPENTTTYQVEDYNVHSVVYRYDLYKGKFEMNDYFFTAGITRKLIYPVWINAGIAYGFGKTKYNISEWRIEYSYFPNQTTYTLIDKFSSQKFKHNYFSYQLGINIVMFESINISYTRNVRNGFTYHNLGIGFGFW